VCFPECVARVPVSLWGSGGWRWVRSTLRLCSQPSATVRDRPQLSAQSPYGRAYGKFCKRGHFWRFHMWRCFVSRGRRGTSWHSDVFGNVSKIVLCGRRNTFATFSEDVLQFSWQAQHFGRAHRHFAWQAQHLDVSCCVFFCASHCQGCVKWRQGANSVAGAAFVRCVENWGSLARNIDFEVANLEVHKKTRRKTSILKPQATKCQNWRKSRLLPRVSSRVSGFSCGLAVSMGL